MIDDSPLVTADRVYVGDARGRLHALDRTSGAVVWSRQLDAHPLTRIFSSPLLVDGLLVVGVASVELALPVSDFAFRGSVVGLDVVTGAERWRLPTGSGADAAGVSVWSSAAIDRERGLAYIGTGQSCEQPAGPRSDSLLAIATRLASSPGPGVHRVLRAGRRLPEQSLPPPRQAAGRRRSDRARRRHLGGWCRGDRF
jgi:polyvinyl alcohol dehydrogenase (cytochrome)